MGNLRDFFEPFWKGSRGGKKGSKKGVSGPKKRCFGAKMGPKRVQKGKTRRKPSAFEVFLGQNGSKKGPKGCFGG